MNRLFVNWKWNAIDSVSNKTKIRLFSDMNKLGRPWPKWARSIIDQCFVCVCFVIHHLIDLIEMGNTATQDLVLTLLTVKRFNCHWYSISDTDKSATPSLSFAPITLQRPKKYFLCDVNPWFYRNSWKSFGILCAIKCEKSAISQLDSVLETNVELIWINFSRDFWNVSEMEINLEQI